MIGRLRQSFRLYREERRLVRDLRATRANLETQGLSDHDVWVESAPESDALEEINERRRLLDNSRLITRAQRLYIPIPPIASKDIKPTDLRDASWERLRSGGWVLRPAAAHALRAEVREELKAQRDYRLGWITPFVSIIAVLLGALLGYFLGARK